MAAAPRDGGTNPTQACACALVDARGRYLIDAHVSVQPVCNVHEHSTEHHRTAPRMLLKEYAVICPSIKSSWKLVRLFDSGPAQLYQLVP